MDIFLLLCSPVTRETHRLSGLPPPVQSISTPIQNDRHSDLPPPVQSISTPIQNDRRSDLSPPVQSISTPIQNDHHIPPALTMGQAPRKGQAKKPQPRWDSEHSDLIRKLRDQRMQWEYIAEQLPGRSSEACRLHYKGLKNRVSQPSIATVDGYVLQEADRILSTDPNKSLASEELHSVPK
jgi:hypothetical protein